ncbi:hypothetical protein X759_31100 [Mesorhizobium sp. LSHC420B00]|nr:hypothetical protein X759_31100 [Mesorhizobium sp. LSHC420B00]
MLNCLAVGFDHNCTRSDNRAVEAGQTGPSAEDTEGQHDDAKADPRGLVPVAGEVCVRWLVGCAGKTRLFGNPHGGGSRHSSCMQERR